MSVGRSHFMGRRTRWGGSLGAFVLLVNIGPGCAPELDGDDGVVETAHLRITTSEDNPICAGTPLFLESELLRISDTLELPLWAESDKVEIRFGFDSVGEVCTHSDPDDIGGCASQEGVVAAQDVGYLASHELVHAIRLSNDLWSIDAFEEGLAQVLSGSNGFPLYTNYPNGDSYVGPIELIELSRAELSRYYPSAQSFVSWLWETYDRPTLMAFMNDPAVTRDSVLPVFEQHFGLSLADAEEAWLVDDRPDPTWGAPCIPERTYSLADGPLELSGDFDCSEPTVYGASSSMALWPMCLDIPETTRVRFSFDADHGSFQVLGREPCEPGPTSAEARRDKYLVAGDALEEEIAGCRYRMLLFSQEPGFPATPYTIRIEEIPG